jgi:DnaJ homolog subfamily B member 12
MFDTGPQFVFNLGGGPGIRMRQFGGNAPQRRPRRQPGDPAEPPPSLKSTLSSLLPLLILFIVPLLSSLFSGITQSPPGPTLRFDAAVPPHTMHRSTPRLKVDYYLNPKEVADYSIRKLSQLDQKAEVNYVGKLRVECEAEVDERNGMMRQAQGFFWQDQELMAHARGLEMRSCNRLDELKVGQFGY